MSQTNKNNNSLVSNTFLLTFGTLTGQLSLIIVTPILTRLYSPEEFGVYSTLSSLIAIFSVTIAFHYELAIPLPKMHHIAKLVLKLCFKLLLASCIIISVLFSITNHFYKYIDINYASGILFIGLLLFGATRIINFWATRKKEFKIISISKALYGICQSTFQLIFGIFNFGVTGLILGTLLSQLISALTLYKTIDKNKFFKSSILNKKIFILVKKYKNFPKFSTISSLINSLCANLPIILLTFIYDVTIVGFYALSYRVLLSPTKILSNSIAQVLYATAPNEYRNKTLNVLCTNIFKSLFAFCLPSFLFLYVYSTQLFSVIFGQNWKFSGYISEILIPFVLISLLSNVFSTIISIINKQKTEVIFQIIFLILSLLSLGSGYYYKHELTTILLFSISTSFLLISKVFWIFLEIQCDFKVIFKIIINESLICLFYIFIIYFISTNTNNTIFSIIYSLMLLIFLHFYNYKFRAIYAI